MVKAWYKGALWLVMLAGFAHATPPSNAAPLGLWMTQDKRGVIGLHMCDQTLCGAIEGMSGFPPDGAIPRDVHGMPQCHLIILKDLRLQADEKWHGTVTNPEDGQTYAAEIWLPADGILRVRGYLGIPLLGSTQLWPPYKGQVQPNCHLS